MSINLRRINANANISNAISSSSKVNSDINIVSSNTKDKLYVVEECSTDKIKINCNIQNNKVSITSSSLCINSIEGTEYTDSYIVTPKAREEQELQTKNKVMKDNVVVLEIPYYEVDNLFEGQTVIIGG